MAPRGPADDGKRFSSDGRCIPIASRREDTREGVQGEGGARDSFVLDRRLADDGKRFLSDGRSVVVCDSSNRREVWREGARDCAGWKGSGFMLRSFFHFFLHLGRYHFL